MNRPGFLEGVAVAVVASVVGSGMLILLLPVLAGALALQAVTCAVGLGYLLYLLRRSRARVGRVSLVVLWAAVTAVAVVLDTSPVGLAAAQLALVWLTRALYLHEGVLAALADLGLCLASLAAAAWAAHQSNSLALTLWCLMLVQAAFVAIPSPTRNRRDAGMATSPDDSFQRAHRAAEAALRRLSTIR